MRTLLIAAVTADGFIARREGEFSMDWTSKEDIKFYVEVTKKAGTVIFGAKTAQTIIAAGRRLPGRRKIVLTHHPEKITAEGFEPTDEAPGQLLERLEKEGAHEVAICGGSQIYSLFLGAGLVDELYLTVEPIIFGNGIPLFSTGREAQLQLRDVQHLNENCLLLHYSVR